MTEREPPSQRQTPEAAVSPADVTAIYQVLIEIRDELRRLHTPPARPPDWVPGITLFRGSAPEPTAAPTESPPPATAPVAPPEPALPTAPAPANQETGPQPEKRRVVLTDRVGAAPAFRTTPKGQTIAQFPLGVHPDSETTEWHTILAFGERAEQLRGTLRKGEQVEVIGYVHTRTIRGKDGKSRTVEEVYASAVRK